MHRSFLFFSPAFLGLTWSALALEFPSSQPVPAASASNSFHVLGGFEMQLIAAEPLVTDPVAITYDADGRAYVCEMNDYPYTDKEKHKHAQENPTDQAIGKVRLLEDTDGDGVFDKATVFADGLSWPTGSACWKGGIFVTATPDVWYLKDTDGDGVADVRTKVFTGFKKLNVQAVMNNPIWGLDHRIYIAGGSNGGEIQRAPGSESVMPTPADFKPLPIKRNDFSFDPRTGDVRLESGARFGNTFDDWGNRFLCNIRNPCQHVVLPYRYLARNPYLIVPSALNDCAEAGDQLPVYRTSPPEPWREFRAKRWVQEGSTLPKSELVGAGVVTSSSGITVYRGDALSTCVRDFAFVADVAGNLFYRMKLVPDGVTFKAVQVDGQKNFCTSDDLWFRPVNFVNAPDGCLHVCDMYREVIEHPWSIPDDIHASLDLLRGRDKGRLWRLAPAAFKNRPTPKLSNATTNELVALLDHPNAWHRETAERLLFERQDKAAVEPLRDLVKNGKTPQGQAAALWTLQSLPFVPEANHTPLSGLGALSDALLNDVLEKSQNNDVVKQALFVALKFFEHRAPSEIGSVDLTISRLSRYHKDLGAMLLPFAMTLNLRVAEADRDCMLATVRTALADTFAKRSIIPPIVSVDRISELVFLLSQRTSPIRSSNDSIDFCEVLSIAGAPDTLGSLCDVPRIVEQYRRQTTDDSQGPIQTPESFAAAIARGMSSRHLALADLNLPPPSAAWWDTFASSRLDKQDQDLSHLTIDDLSLVAITRAPKGLDILARCIANLQTPDLQLAALEALGSYQLPAVADILIDSWPQLTPVLRDKATTLLLSRTDRIAKLLDAIEAKRITPAQLSIAAKATLGRQKTPALAERIARLIGDGAASNRAGVIAQYTAALSLTGDAAQGAKVYEAACMVCHRHKDRGNDVGPNLGTIKAWTAEQILTNILDPNREVSPNFALYVVETKDGRTLSGLIASETAGNLTLRRADGGTDSILRSEIRSLTSPGTSLMPEGLEAAITPQQMADLIAWLRAD